MADEMRPKESLEAVRKGLRETRETIRGEHVALRDHLAAFDTDAAKRALTPEYRTSQATAYKAAALQRTRTAAEESLGIAERILGEERPFLTREAYLRSARFASGKTETAQLLEEIRLLRVATELPRMTPRRLIDEIKDAGRSKNVALLRVLQHEVATRPHDLKNDALTELHGKMAAAVQELELPASYAENEKLLDEIEQLKKDIESGSEAIRTGKDDPSIRNEKIRNEGWGPEQEIATIAEHQARKANAAKIEKLAAAEIALAAKSQATVQ